MDKCKKLLKIISAAAFIFFIMAIKPASAFDGATLSEIKISSKDNYSYKIILKADKDVPVEKNITSDNQIVIDLKNTRTAESVNTIYNNASEIDNVFVQSIVGNKIRIFIKGLNIASSKIILDSRSEVLDFTEEGGAPAAATAVSSQQTSQPAQDSQNNSEPPVINLGENTTSNVANTQPSENIMQDINNNAPVEKIDENNTNAVKTSMISAVSLKKMFSKEGFDWLLRIFALIFVIIGAVKLLNKPKNVTIDLSSENLKTRELDLYRSLNDRKELASKSLGSSAAGENFSGKSAYAANAGYGLKEYRNSQIPPQKLNRNTENLNTLYNRATSPVINPEMRNTATKMQKNSSAYQKSAVNNSKIGQKEIKTAKTNIDNIKFLESMASIYQKSGRDDLARNIRQNIIRNKTAG